jgi:hypothetical protein
MKIITENQTHLVLRQSSILGIALGIIFVLAGLLILISSSFFGFDLPAWIGGILVLFGLVPFALHKSITITADKYRNSLSSVEKGFIGSGNKVECTIGDIKAVEMRETYKMDSDDDISSNVSIHVWLKNEQSIELAKYSPPSGFFYDFIKTEKTDKENIRRIATYLNVEFREVRPPTFKESLEAIRHGIEKRLEKSSKD